MTAQQWALAVRKRGNHTCAYCGSTHRIEAHHIKSQRTHPELALEVGNGISLCHKCHLTVHGGSYNPHAKSFDPKYTDEYCEPIRQFVRNYNQKGDRE
jgi:ribosomal protein L37AE/L43A